MMTVMIKLALILDRCLKVVVCWAPEAGECRRWGLRTYFVVVMWKKESGIGPAIQK